MYNFEEIKNFVSKQLEVFNQIKDGYDYYDKLFNTKFDIPFEDVLSGNSFVEINRLKKYIDLENLPETTLAKVVSKILDDNDTVYLNYEDLMFLLMKENELLPEKTNSFYIENDIVKLRVDSDLTYYKENNYSILYLFVVLDLKTKTICSDFEIKFVKLMSKFLEDFKQMKKDLNMISEFNVEVVNKLPPYFVSYTFDKNEKIFLDAVTKKYPEYVSITVDENGYLQYDIHPIVFIKDESLKEIAPSYPLNIKKSKPVIDKDMVHLVSIFEWKIKKIF